MNKFIPILIVSMGVITGCASPRFTKQGATEDQFLKDRYECIQQTQQRIESASFSQGEGSYSSSIIPSCSVLMSCLVSKGYFKSEKGDLFIPEGAEVKCKR